MSTQMTEARASRALVELTEEIFPGLLLAGIAVATAYGLSRMEPTFRGVLFPRKWAARLTVGSPRERSVHGPAIGDEKSTEVAAGYPSSEQ